MPVDRAPWSLNDLGFTITFTRGLTPAQVLTRYGFAAQQAQLITRAQFLAVPLPARTPPPTLVAAGMLRRWAFCYEEIGCLGTDRRVLGDLSEGTDTLSLYDIGGMTVFSHWRDGFRHEGFEPGFPGSRRDLGHRPFWDRMQARRTPGVLRSRTALAVIEEHIGGELTADLLTGRLLRLAIPGPGTAEPTAATVVPVPGPPLRASGRLDPGASHREPDDGPHPDSGENRRNLL